MSSCSPVRPSRSTTLPLRRAPSVGGRSRSRPTRPTTTLSRQRSPARSGEFGRLDTVVNVVGGYVPKPFLGTSDDDLRGLVRPQRRPRARTRPRVCPPPRRVRRRQRRDDLERDRPRHRSRLGRLRHRQGRTRTRGAANGARPQPPNPRQCGGARRDHDRCTRGLRRRLGPHRWPEGGDTTSHRIGSAEEVAAAVLYLAAPSGAFTTGHVLPVDGGLQVTNMEMPFPDV